MEFTTIDTATVLQLAYNALLEQWCNEIQRQARLSERGQASPIADARIAKYEAQLAELHNKIKEAESEQ